MFEGSQHLPKGAADRLLTAAGASNNGGTAQDQTVYWEQAPAGALAQLLYIESERMGWLLPTLDQARLDNQRDVVRNERRQNYEMRPYGLAYERLMAALWNPEFPYHWLPIGTHEGRGGGHARRREGVLPDAGTGRRTRSSPSPATSTRPRRGAGGAWFGAIPSRARPARNLPGPVPAHRREAAGDGGQGAAPAAVPGLADARGSSPPATPPWTCSGRSSPTARAPASIRSPGDEGADRPGGLGRPVEPGPGQRASWWWPRPSPGWRWSGWSRRSTRSWRASPPSRPPRWSWSGRATSWRSAAVFGLEPVGGFGGRAASLADYYVRTGDPGYLERDLARYREVTAEEVSAAARTCLRKDARVVLQVRPGRQRPTPGAPPSPTAPEVSREDPDPPCAGRLLVAALACATPQPPAPQRRPRPAAGPAAAVRPEAVRTPSRPSPAAAAASARSPTRPPPPLGTERRRWPARPCAPGPAPLHPRQRAARPAGGAPPPAHRGAGARGGRRRRARPGRAARPGDLHRRHGHRGHRHPHLRPGSPTRSASWARRSAPAPAPTAPRSAAPACPST